jgi:DNA primase
LISDETLLEVRRSVDIVEVVSAYFPLKRRGANYWAPCPFHEEKTPSFSVHAEKQIYKCFGCGKAGGVVDFVMEYLKVDFPEAICLLAEKSGIPVKYTGRPEGGPPRDELLRANEWAAGVFRELLKTSPQGEAARQFFARRGVSDETAEVFGLGYSMDSWDCLLDRARRNGISAETMVAAGLARKREGKEGHYDFFRGRAMFPIVERSGRTVAFGARTLGDDQPKFINSPESKIFSKGRGFYGLHLARDEWEKTRTAYVVEGYLDVVVPWQAGVRGLVATLGTALTRDHLKVLRRHVDKVVLVFDGDAAGQKASERGLDLLLAEDLEAFVAGLPEGMDPDDVVVKRGPDALREVLEKPKEVFEFLMESLLRKHGEATPAAKTRVVEEVLQRVASVPSAVKREFLLQQLARRFGVDEGALKGRLETLGREDAPAEEPPPAAAAAAVGPVEEALRGLLAYAARVPSAMDPVRRAMPLGRFPSGPLRRVAEVIYELQDKTGRVDSGDLMAKLSQEPKAREAAAGILDVKIDAEMAERKVSGYLDRLESEESRQESVELEKGLKGASSEEDRNNYLMRVMEARRKRPVDHGILPGRRRKGV